MTDYSGYGLVALREECDEKGIKYAKKDTKHAKKDTAETLRAKLSPKKVE